MQILRRESPDLLVLDLMLPDKDGWEITRTLRFASPKGMRSAIPEGACYGVILMIPLGEKTLELEKTYPRKRGGRVLEKKHE